MKKALVALVVLGSASIGSAQDLGAASWRCLKNLTTAGECGQLSGPIDLKAGTTLNGSVIAAGSGVVELDQTAGETDLRYDATLESYYVDTDGDGSRDVDGTEPFLDLSVIEVPGDFSSIQAALDSNDCEKGSTNANQGCRIVASGTRAERFEISDASTTANQQWSIIVEGKGGGGYGAGGNNLCALTLTGDGSAGHAVISIDDTNGVIIRNLCIDMDTGAANDPLYGIAIGTSTASDTVNKHIILEQISIWDAGAVGGAGILMGNGGGTTSDTAFNELRSIYMEGVRTCLRVDAVQTVTNYVKNLNCANPTASIGGIDIIDGQLAVVEGMCFTPGAANQIMVNIMNEATGLGLFTGGTIEWDTDDGVIFNFDDTSNTGNWHSTTIADTRFNIQDIPTVRHKCINWDRRGTLNILNNSFESDTSSSRTCEIFLRNADASSASYVHYAGNDVEWAGTQSAMVFDESTAGGRLSVTRDEQGTRTVGEYGSIVYEGATLDGFETTLAVTDPTADRTVTFPNANSNTVQPQTCTPGEYMTGISSAGVITCAP